MFMKDSHYKDHRLEIDDNIVVLVNPSPDEL